MDNIFLGNVDNTRCCGTMEQRRKDVGVIYMMDFLGKVLFRRIIRHP
jgi:hypothetical protein